jgi:adenine-specific DNA-methyltransferase
MNVRYIGNKTRLLGFIADVLEDRGIRPGTAVDPFSGTASVAADLKRRGFRVVASDIMEYAYVFARAYVEVPRLPSAPALQDIVGSDDDSLESILSYLDRLDGEPAFVHEHYSPDGGDGAIHGRMYFTPANAARIDAIRGVLDGWQRHRLIDGDTFHVLLAALLEAADRVANTTGVYAAFVKSWQPNATRPLELRVPAVVPGNGCRAARRDAVDLVSELPDFDLLYLDPPYNSRQYAGYYHIPELIALGWFDGDVQTRGKTGLIGDERTRSDWSRRSRCEAAFEKLVDTARWKHLVLSYNAEGIIPEDTIRRTLCGCGRAATYRRHELVYRRYRSDSDGDNRRYRADEVKEYLYCVDR